MSGNMELCFHVRIHGTLLELCFHVRKHGTLFPFQLNNDRSLFPLDSDKGVFCHHSFSQSTSGLHNSESLKGQIININLLQATYVYFSSMWRFRCSMEEILEQLLIRGQAFATFSTIEKALTGCKKRFCKPSVVQAGYK